MAVNVVRIMWSRLRVWFSVWRQLRDLQIEPTKKEVLGWIQAGYCPASMVARCQCHGRHGRALADRLIALLAA